jgi:hypothetical protein
MGQRGRQPPALLVAVAQLQPAAGLGLLRQGLLGQCRGLARAPFTRELVCQGAQHRRWAGRGGQRQPALVQLDRRHAEAGRGQFMAQVQADVHARGRGAQRVVEGCDGLVTPAGPAQEQAQVEMQLRLGRRHRRSGARFFDKGVVG